MTTEIKDNNIVDNAEKKRELQPGEKILLFTAFIAAVLCDRLFFNVAIKQTDNIFYFTAVFEVCFIILFYVCNWGKIYKSALLWVIAGLLILLCAWNFIFDYASSYGSLTFVVIPASLMMFTQLAVINHGLKDIGGMVASWFSGWFIKPFCAIAKCIEALSAVLFPKGGKNSHIIKKVIAAVVITAPLITLLIFLLSGADKVFGYYTNKIFASFDIGEFILHAFLIAAGFLLFYSFFWNGRYAKPKCYDNTVKKEYRADNLVVYIILSSVLVLYVLFCAVQFAYLFASAGLPAGISYSEYAREGFAQIVVISGINLIIFGCVLKYGKIHKPEEKDWILKIMLYILIAVTAIMLTSGFMRLGLYINTFGMTFLRLISAWFIIYLSLVLVLCAARLIKEKLPLIACCAVLLLFAYTALGYMNPDAFIVKYNLSENSGYSGADRVNGWVGQNSAYVFYNLSDDALNVLLSEGLDKNDYAGLLERRSVESAGKRSLASMKLRAALHLFDGAE